MLMQRTITMAGFNDPSGRELNDATLVEAAGFPG